ncbi:hypothetical protein D5086_002589 [Populus alba]|uniref:Uncharacterized protein n=1 Tax=Populus alba TaxID=43335 RepID=A0ACC4D2R8_POPAL
MNSSDHQECARSKETGGPRLFSDFGKLAYELLLYRINQSCNISTSSDIGLTLTPYAAGHQKQSKAAVTAEYNLEDTHATIKVDVNPGLPFQILHKVQYFHKRAALAMTLPLLRSPLVRLSATVGTEHLAFAVAVIGRALSRKENSFLVEGSWIVDDLTTIKGRFDSRGKLAATLRYKIKPKSFFTISGEFEPKALDKTPEIRLERRRRFAASTISRPHTATNAGGISGPFHCLAFRISTAHKKL